MTRIAIISDIHANIHALKALLSFLDERFPVSKILNLGDFIQIGHTHLPLHAVYWNGRPIVNPGSVGCGKDGRVRFVTMELEDDAVSVSYRQLKYDKERVLLDYRERSVPCADRFISLFY